MVGYFYEFEFFVILRDQRYIIIFLMLVMLMISKYLPELNI